MLLGGALEETRDDADSRDEKSFLGRDTTEGTPVARAYCPKKSVRGDGLYLAVKRFLSPCHPKNVARRLGGYPAIRVGLEPSSDVPRDEHECQRTGIPG